ncbi:hypothetical protein AA310_03150 [Arthrobacter sp. YC-RL1]|uniref:Uncharacterized protein n=1 Tax=Glutamicibacter soli TaxID=453836 RepID=A0A365YBB2_9MICC|nr:hypothetical protein AFL94_01055 [Arthrobacter sp. LS16]ALQ32061.1 hypothetical protein ATC04_16960 [Arthrobacter sp. YC-RL1]KLI90361.1 hypothetical protein AA310_03150 [Arthrobacter sp. YC-RL1]RBL99984.1 hypothetical protein C1H84_12655 [Glutamicibacter soli]
MIADAHGTGSQRLLQFPGDLPQPIRTDTRLKFTGERPECLGGCREALVFHVRRQFTQLLRNLPERFAF